jgi:hypothetical protein
MSLVPLSRPSYARPGIAGERIRGGNMRIFRNRLRDVPTLLLAFSIVLGAGYPVSAAQNQGTTPWDVWALAVETDPFGIPGGTLPGLVTIHRDGTLMISDGGDIGAFPFATTDTPQHGVWIQNGPRSIEAVSLFLRKDEVTGEIEGWHRVRLTLGFGADNDHLVGEAREEVLVCNPAEPTDFRLFNCPDPTVGAFEPAPFAIPVRLTRLRVR